MKAVEVMDQWENTDMTNAELVRSLISIAGFEECGGCPECSFVAFSNYAVSIPDTNSKTCLKCLGWEKCRVAPSV